MKNIEVDNNSKLYFPLGYLEILYALNKTIC